MVALLAKFRSGSFDFYIWDTRKTYPLECQDRGGRRDHHLGRDGAAWSGDQGGVATAAWGRFSHTGGGAPGPQGENIFLS